MPIQIGPEPLGSRHAVFDLCRVSNRQSPALLDDGRIHDHSVNVCKHCWQPLVRISTYRSQSCAGWYCGFIPPWTDFDQLLLSRSPESKLHLRRLESDCLYERVDLAYPYKPFFPTDITLLFNERKNNREKEVLSSICRADVEQVCSRRRSRIVIFVIAVDHRTQELMERYIVSTSFRNDVQDFAGINVPTPNERLYEPKCDSYIAATQVVNELNKVSARPK